MNDAKMKSTQKPILKNSASRETHETRVKVSVVNQPRDRAKSACSIKPKVEKDKREDRFQPHFEHDYGKDRALSAASRKVTFMINDEVVQTDQISIDKEDSMLLEGDIDDALSSDDLLKDSARSKEDEEITRQELYLEDLQAIDEMYSTIEQEIQTLAIRESKEVSDIDALLEAATEQERDMGTGGLDKIVERDDEGGGEQVDDEDSPRVQQTTLAEEIDRICQLKTKL